MRGRLVPAGWALAALALPLVADAYVLDVVVFALILALAASAWNVTGGYAGLFSLGHAVFFGLGAYTSTLLFLRAGISPWIGLLAGAALSVVAALVLGGVTIRLRGPFFALATLAAGQVLQIVAINWHDLTRGTEGLRIPFRPGWQNMLFSERSAYFYLALAFVAGAYLLARSLERSRFGYRLMALRENGEAAEALGVPTVRTRLTAFALSAALAAAAGTLYAQYVAFIDPIHSFALDLSIQLALMSIIGGLGTASGPIVGAFLITLLSSFLRAGFGSGVGGLHLVIYGGLLVVVVLFVPEGLIPWARGLFRRRRIRRGAAARAA